MNVETEPPAPSDPCPNTKTTQKQNKKGSRAFSDGSDSRAPPPVLAPPRAPLRPVCARVGRTRRWRMRPISASRPRRASMSDSWRSSIKTKLPSQGRERARIACRKGAGGIPNEIRRIRSEEAALKVPLSNRGGRTKSLKDSADLDSSSEPRASPEPSVRHFFSSAAPPFVLLFPLRLGSQGDPRFLSHRTAIRTPKKRESMCGPRMGRAAAPDGCPEISRF